MKKNSEKKDEKSYVAVVNAGENYVIRDEENGSKAWVPISVGEGIAVEVVQVDKGLVRDLPEGKHICDSLVFTLQNSTCPRITWFIELKGSKNPKEAGHAISQIAESIQHLCDENICPQGRRYLEKRDYVFAAVAGALNKTIPAMNNDEIKSLCRKLYALCGKKVKDMASLFCYIKLSDSCKTWQKRGNRPPFEFVCYNKPGEYLPFPSALLEQKNG